MEERKIVRGYYIDPLTQLKFIDYDRSNYTLLNEYKVGETTLVIPNSEELEKQLKRHKIILEKLRMENNWLWGIVEKALNDDRKQSAGYAIRQLQKAIKERTR